MASHGDWWGYSQYQGWVVLDRDDPRNESKHQLYFLRCSDWTELPVLRADWHERAFPFAQNYIATLSGQARVEAERLLQDLEEEWREKKVTLAKEKAIAVRRAFWTKEIQQDIDDENYVRAKERFIANCADWWVIDIDELLTQIRELNQRRLTIAKENQKRKCREDQKREMEAERTRQVLPLAEEMAAAHVPKRQHFKTYRHVRIAAQALSYLTNEPVDIERDGSDVVGWVLRHDIDHLVGLYALRFDLNPPPEVPTWWTEASTQFSYWTGESDLLIDSLSEAASEMHYVRHSGCAPVYEEKTAARLKMEENYKEEQYYEKIEAAPTYQADVQNQRNADTFADSDSSEGYWNSFSSATHKPDQHE